MATRPKLQTLAARKSSFWSRRFRGDYRRLCQIKPTFELLEYRLPLTLDYSTYLGGSNNDFADDIATDSQGNTYVLGTTRSPNLAGVASPDSGTNRVFLKKFKPDGQIDDTFEAVVGPTPKFDAGGFAESLGWQIVVGADDLPIITYETFQTATIPLEAGGLLPLPGAPHEIHIAKLDATGKTIFETKLPVFNDEPGRSAPYGFLDVKLVIDNVDSIYVAYTAIRYTFGFVEAYDTFLTQLFPSGELRQTDRLGTRLSAMAIEGDAGAGLANLYIVHSGLQDDGTTDVLISKYDQSINLLDIAAFGGDRNESVNAIAMDPANPGRIYLVGQTNSEDFVLKNPFQTLPVPGPPSFGFTNNGFITLLDLRLEGKDRLIASTYFGGSRNDTLTDVSLDIAGNVYVAGFSNSPDLPVVQPLQLLSEAKYGLQFGSPQFASDIVIAKFDTEITKPEFSTYFGGKGVDFNPLLSIGGDGTIHVAATTVGRNRDTVDQFVGTADFPVKKAFQSDFGGSNVGSQQATDAVVFAITQQGTMVGRGARATAGREFTNVVAEFTSGRRASSSEFTVEINWGDGTNSSGFVTQSESDESRFYVHGTHLYNKPGAFPVRVTVTDNVATELSPLRAINVSQSKRSQVAGTIAVDPNHPQRLFAAMSDLGSVTGIRVAVSENSGQTWSPRLVGGVDDKALPKALGNPDVLYDEFGNLFLAYSGVDDNIVIAWSTDGGLSFKAENRFDIRISSPAGTSAGSPRLAYSSARNEIWITYETEVVQVTGAKVLGLGDVGIFAELTVPGSLGGKHSDIDVGPDGAVAVIWQAVNENGNAELQAIVDADGFDAAVFSLKVTVDSSTTNGQLHTPAQLPTVPLSPRLAWDTSNGPHRGRLYATYVDLVEGLPNPPGAPEVTLFVTYSDDRGATWSTATRVTFSPDFQSMFQPSIAVDPTSGVLAVGWYGTTGSDPAELSAFTGFFVATSTDGKTFSNAQRVNTHASNVISPDENELDVAHYTSSGMAFFDGRLYPIWSDNSEMEGSNDSAPYFETAVRVVGVIDVQVAPPAVRPIPIDAIRGQSFTKPVATFTVLDPSVSISNYTAQISWGDQAGAVASEGAISQPAGPGTPFIVTGTHTYEELGSYLVAITVIDVRTGVAIKSVSNVSAQQGSQAQPTIAVDPTNPNRLFAAWSDHASLEKGIPVATSEDGGITWHRRTIANGNDGLFLPSQAGSAVFDKFGNLFLTYVTRAPILNTVVLSSKDGGKGFTLLRKFETPLSVEPSIAVGPGENGKGGSVWVTWSHGPADNLTVDVAGAQVDGLDRFQSFSQRTVAPVNHDGLLRSYGDIAVGPQGQVLVTYSKGVVGGTSTGPVELMVQLDPDGLGTQPFGSPIRVTDTNVGPGTSIPPQAIGAIDADGSLAWDLSDGEHRGRVYLIYTDSATVGDPDTEILLRFSDDNGATWSLPTLIDNTTKTSFMPSIAVDPSTGNVAMAWYSSEGNAADGSTSSSFIVTLSDDGGRSHRVHYVVGPGPSDATSSSITDKGRQVQFGGFSGLAFSSGILQPIWTDNSLELDGVPDPRNFDIASARIGVAQVSNQPLVVQMIEVEEREGASFTRQIATFTDPSGNGSASDYRATIDWGDGSPLTDGEIVEEAGGGFSVSGSHEYQKFGNYSISVKIRGNHTKGTGVATAIISNASVFLNFGDGSEEQELRVVRETNFTKVIATFVDENPFSVESDFDVTIDWGDGTFSDGTLAFTFDGGPGETNTYSISGSHKYQSEQSFTVQISAREKSSGIRTDQSGTLVSGDPPLEVKPGDFLDIEALEGINTGDLALARFTLPDDVEVPIQTALGGYIATINWGDGSVDRNIIPFVTSEDVTIVGRHTYATAGEYYPSITLQDDSGGVFFVPLIAIVEPDVTNQVSAPLPALAYNPVTERFVGELVITNTSSADISGPLFVVVHGLPDGVSLDSFTAFDGVGNPLHKVNQSKLPAGSSLPPISMEFSNPNRVPIHYSVQVFDGLRPQPQGGASVVFEPNRGQANEAIGFIARGQGYTIGLSAGQVSLVLSGTDTQAGTAALVELVGASASPVGTAMDPLPGTSNYFVGQNAITGVPHFGRVRYSQVYSGIDIEYYGREGLLEYDWIVRPHADTEAISVRFRGANEMSLDSAGNLRLQVTGGELVQRAPVAYQTIGGNHISIAASYDLRADGTVGINLGAYDTSQVLVIDPVLVYSTYLGGSGFEIANAIAVDAAGNTYVAGSTGSSDFYTVNPYDPELNQPDTSPFALSVDAFVTKFDANGTIVYSTYLGGGSSGFDPTIRETQARSISVDSEGRVWVAGVTQSHLFPKTTNAPIGYEANPETGGSFLTQFSADGSRILYSSVNSLSVIDIAVDDAGDVYAAGIGFSLKLDPTTNHFEYVKLLGNATARGIAVDSVGQAYITGFTNSPTFPVKNALFPILGTPETLHPADRSGTGFVVKLSADGSTQFSTYLGSTFEVFPNDIAVDDSGTIYIAGATTDLDLPVPGGLDTSINGGLDGFLIKMANDGQSLPYGTYIGGSGDDRVTGVAVDSRGRAYLSGTTNSVNLPTVRAHQSTFGGSLFLNDFPNDGFAASIASDGKSFEYLTYLGGKSVDSLAGVAVDAKGNASFAGNTISPDMLISNAAQPRLIGTPALIVRLLAGDAGTVTIHNAPFTAVEGKTYNGTVAFFTSNGTETADQFSAIIDWGDGQASPGTITGNYHEGFQVIGNHLYQDVGKHDVFVTLRDSVGRKVTVTRSSAIIVGADERVRYHLAIDTASLAGIQGQLSFQFNAIAESVEFEARIANLQIRGGVVGTNAIDGNVIQVSNDQFTLRPSSVLNRLIQRVTLGAQIEFDLELVGSGVAGLESSVFVVQLLNASGNAPLLPSDSSASILRVLVSSDGKTVARVSNAAVSAAASGTATVVNGPIDLTLAPFTIQEGLEYNGPVATFTDGNPFEIARDFTAEIDWGDGSPITSGIVTGNAGQFTVLGSHIYRTAGAYAMAVKVIDPDGTEVSRRTGRSILAAQTIKNNWRSSTVPPVAGDFNGDGILDLAIGPYLAIPSGTGEGVGIFLGRGDGSFVQSDLKATGTTISQLAAADYNNDGRLDIAVAITRFGESTVELLLGNGDGTLQPSIALSELRNPSTLAAIDVNRDGNADLVYIQSDTPTQNTRSSILRVALGRGDGTFVAPRLTTIPFGVQRTESADLNRDAIPDLLLATTDVSGATTLRLYRGIGDGSFAAPVTIASGLALVTSMLIRDFDADGNSDVAASAGSNVLIYSGNGDGSFDSPTQIATVSGVITAGDFNRDGRIDLALADRGSGSNLGRLVVLRNESTGYVSTKYEGVASPATLFSADFDRDGNLDLATSGTFAAISVMQGLGDGTFTSAQRYATGLVRVDPSASFRETAQGVIVADVNGDSQNDAVLLFGDGPTVTQLGNSDGTFRPVVSSGSFSALNSGNVGLGFGSFRNPVLADFNNDGRLDLVGTSQQSGIGIVFGGGDGSFPTNHVEAPGATAKVIGDFNSDGRPDLAAVGNNGVNVYLARPDGTYPDFQNSAQYPTGAGPRSIVTGDFNGDTRLDLAVANGIGTVSVLLGNANGTFAAALNVTVGVSPFGGSSGIQPQSLRSGDFNGDGKLDLVVLGFAGTGLVLPGNGNGTFGTSVTFTTLGGLDGGLNAGRHIAVGDFNADGKLDIVAASEGHANFFIQGGGLSVLLGNGDLTFQPAVTYADRSNPTAITLADFNRDGRLDIAMANINNGRALTGQVSILLGNPNGTFQNPSNYATVGANPRAIASGDLNADGIPDLSVFNNSGDTAILLGTGTGTFRSSVNYFTRGDGLLSGPIGINIGDFNNDGHTDVISSSTFLFGRGDGTFPNRQLVTYLPPVINVDIRTSLPSEVAAGDLNADGNVDLVVAIAGSTVVLFGNGNGTFKSPVRLDPPAAIGLEPTSNRVSLSDMDGDGDLDVVTLHARIGQTGGGVAVWRNNGQGIFSVPSMRSVPFPAYEANTVTGPDLEVGDLNGDSFLDVAIADSGLRGTDSNASGGVSVLLGIGDGNLGLPTRYLMPARQSAYGVKLGDLDHDGYPELVMLSSPLGFDFSRSAVVVLANNGDGTFSQSKLLEFGGSAAMFLATGDFNGDGREDIIIPNSDANSFSMIYAGDGPVIVTDAPVTVVGTNLNPKVGIAFTATVATFTDENPFGIASDFTATIDWGDGQTSAGTIRVNPLGGFQVTGSHMYATIGAFTTKISVREIGRGTHLGSATARVNVADPLIAATGLIFDAMEKLPFEGIIVTFTDADANGSVGDFNATMDWGDGASSTGTITTKAGGGFNVFGTHTYATAGTFSVLVTINDIGGSSTQATSTARVAQRVNRPPVAINDSYMTQEDRTLVVTASRGFLANDTDLDRDVLNSVVVALPTHGTLTPSSNGAFVYVPAANFFGIDSFTYRANDGTANSNLATATITVNPVNDAAVAANDSTTTDEDTVVVVNILANDIDVDDTINSATVVITAQPTNGLAQVNIATGQVTYTPASNFFGFDSFRYRVMDDAGLTSNIATVSVFVRPINDVPIAKNDAYWVNEDSTRSINAANGLLQNDTDVDGDPLTATLVVAPTHGVLTLRPDGSFTYTPTANFFGADSFVYRIGDGLALSPPATVSLSILPANDSPLIASMVDVAIPEGTVLNRTGSFNDIDPNDSWTATVDFGDGSGVQSLVLNGKNFALNHQFTESGDYVATVMVVDQDGGIGTATFEVSVQNLAATVNAGLDQSTTEGAVVNIAASFVDPGTFDTHTALIDWGDGTVPTTVTVTESMGLGSLIANHVYADNGTYTVTLSVTDDEGALGSDQLTITVGNVAPSIEVGPDRTSSEGQMFLIDFVFSDPGSGDTHTMIIDWGDGTLETAKLRRVANGWSASPSHRYIDDGIYTVTVTVKDDDDAVIADSFRVAVGNLAPLVDSGPDRELNLGEFVELPSVNFADLFSDQLSLNRLIRQSGSFVDLGAVDTHVAMIDWGDGTIEPVLVTERIIGPQNAPISASGVVNARHRYARPGIYTATLRVTDNDGGVGTDSFVVTVLTSGNNPPIANDDEVSLDEDTERFVNVLANDSFAPDLNETLSVTAITQPSHGRATLNSDGSVTYIPNLNYFGADSFSYTIDDGRSGTASATVRVIVNPVNDVAIIGGVSSGALTEDDAVNQVSGVLTVNDPDPGESVFQEPLNLQGKYGAFTFIAATGDWTYTLDNSRPATDALATGQVVTETLLVRSFDGTATGSILVTIKGVDSPIDVTSMITVRYYGAQYNARTKTYAFFGTITNKSNQPIRGPIELGWSNLRPSSARAKGNTGIWPDGSPYFDLSTFVGSDGILLPGETSQPRTFAVTVASPGAYSFATRVTGVVSLGNANGEFAQSGDLGSLPFDETDIHTLESEILYFPKLNVRHPMDVNNDGLVSPIDALLVIDTLTLKGSRSLAVDESDAPYVDTSADNQVSPLDALLVIDSLSRQYRAGEGEAPRDEMRMSSTMAPVVDEFFGSLGHEPIKDRSSESHFDVTEFHQSHGRNAPQHQPFRLQLAADWTRANRFKSSQKVGLTDRDLDMLATDLANEATFAKPQLITWH